MNLHLSSWLLCGVLFLWPLTASGQGTNSSAAERAISSTPSFQAEYSPEISSRTGTSVSVRELSIPERAGKAYKRGIERLAKHDPAGSLVHLQSAVSEFPNFYEAYYAIGLAQLNLEHEEEAQQAFQKSIDASGGHYAEPYLGLGALLCNRQEFIEAELIARKALELAPGFGPSHFILALALLGLNRLDEAEMNADAALMRDPRLAPTHLLLANIYNRRSDHLAVLGELDAYLRLKPEGAQSDEARRVEESLKRKLGMSGVVVAAARAKP